jgi:energy-coupling factor transport system permease protein
VRRVGRNLHPMAWWVWAIGLATAVSRTTNPVLLLLALASVGYVVARRRTEAPWARAFKYYLAVALVVIVIRVVFRAVFGGDVSPTDHILFRLPQVPLPKWADGVQLGGPVSLEATLSAGLDGLRLGCLLCCIGAANALANPKRALRVLPGALYELAVAVVVAISVAPQLIESIQRVRRARRLRPVSAGRNRLLRRGRALGGILIPVLEDALERSLRLAAAMDSRGFGRTGYASRRDRRVTGALMLGGMGGLCVGAYGLLDATTPRLLGLPALGVGCLLCTGGLGLGGRRVRRSHYRPDPWRAAEWAVAACGVVPAVVLIGTVGFPVGQLDPSLVPLAWPPVPILAAVAVACAGLAGVVSPAPARRSRPLGRRDQRVVPGAASGAPSRVATSGTPA